jgi:exodeoxyribonuclease VII small subunit
MNKKGTLKSDFEELTKLTEEFESGKISLEEAMPKFRRGLELSRRIKKRLEEIENEIHEIKNEFRDLEELPGGMNEEELGDDSLEEQTPF